MRVVIICWYQGSDGGLYIFFFLSYQVEDCDSGTASDEESPEVQLQLLQEGM